LRDGEGGVNVRVCYLKLTGEWALVG
jgi:hypothetical protein